MIDDLKEANICARRVYLSCDLHANLKGRGKGWSKTDFWDSMSKRSISIRYGCSVQDDLEIQLGLLKFGHNSRD